MRKIASADTNRDRKHSDIRERIFNADRNHDRQNVNFYFVATAAIILLVALPFICCGDLSDATIGGNMPFFFIFGHLIFNPFIHSSTGQLLGNLLCFLLVGAYLERKKGSFTFALIFLSVLFFSSIGASVAMVSMVWNGFSCVNFGLFAYAIVDYIFSFGRLNRTEKIVGGAMMAVIYFCSCFDIGRGFVRLYPYALFGLQFNLGAFLCGAILCLVLNVSVMLNGRDKASGKIGNFFPDLKEKQWWNANFLFVCTVTITLVCFIIYLTYGNDWMDGLYGSSVFYYIFMGLCNSIGHSNFQHVLGNMMCFVVLGVYLERKKGTFRLLMLVLVLMFYSSMLITAADGSLWWIGFSGVNFALYGYVIVDYIFTLCRKEKSKFDVISGAVMMGLIYLAMCHNGGTEGFSFAPYPYDLIHNDGHYVGIIVGMTLTLCIRLASMFDSLSKSDDRVNH